MNKELLFQLYSIHSPSGGEKKMRKFVKRYIRKNCGECIIEQDVFGNVFVTKGVSETYPCLASHLDQVQHAHSKDFECVEGKDVVFGFSYKSREQQGLGADDKNGIWICLECLREFSVLKCAFFVGEETGCVGSRQCDLTFFKDCRYIIQPDRRGGSDLITSMFCGEVCSDDFVKALGAEMYGYKEATGSVTDVGELVERGVGISCLNLSCGYYEPHTSEEFTVLSELQNCLNFVCHIIDTLTDVYPHEYEGWASLYKDYGKRSRYGYGYYDGYYDWWDDDDYWNNGSYDEDYESMREIVSYNEDITFDEIVETGGFLSNFITRDMDILQCMFDDAKEEFAHHEDFVDDDGFDWLKETKAM